MKQQFEDAKLKAEPHHQYLQYSYEGPVRKNSQLKRFQGVIRQISSHMRSNKKRQLCIMPNGFLQKQKSAKGLQTQRKEPRENSLAKYHVGLFKSWARAKSRGGKFFEYKTEFSPRVSIARRLKCVAYTGNAANT